MITKLEKEFIGKGEVKGFKFTQIVETDVNYTYKVETFDNTIHYETFEKRVVPICLDFDNRIYSETDFKEIYPKSNDFGVWAWTHAEPIYKIR